MTILIGTDLFGHTGSDWGHFESSAPMLATFINSFDRAQLQPPTDNHPSWYAFLAPSCGARSLKSLRQHLGFKANHTFHPHITIGSFRSESECQNFVNIYNRTARPIIANINKVSVVQAQADGLIIIREITLNAISV